MNMRKYIIPILTAAVLVGTSTAYAGNPQRGGSAGATQLLINPWARSAGMAGANMAHVEGLEGMFLNVGGLAHTQKTELIFSHTSFFADIGINAFGFTQKVGENGVLGFGVMSFDFGEIDITTEDNPDGSLGTYSPSFSNLGISYAKKFTESIYGGFTVKVVQEAIPDLKSSGVAFDAGIQYITGVNKHIRFGISLKNVGPPMAFSGDGMSIRLTEKGGDYQMALEQRSESYEMPALIKIGGAYDFIFTEGQSKLTLAGTFTSNSFTRDQFALGFDFNLRNILHLRAGYEYEEGITGESTRFTAFTGPTAGASVVIPLGESGTTFSLDYAYRSADPFANVHNIGARINL